jgi:hypothetical protein
MMWNHDLINFILIIYFLAPLKSTHFIKICHFNNLYFLNADNHCLVHLYFIGTCHGRINLYLAFRINYIISFPFLYSLKVNYIYI